MNKKKLLFLFCCFFVSSNCSLSVQKANFDQRNNGRKQYLKHSFDRRINGQKQFHEEKYNLKTIRESNKYFHFSHKINLHDPRYQIFIGFFLLGMIQANLDTGNSKDLAEKPDDDKSINLPGQLKMYASHTCPKDTCFQKHAPFNSQCFQMSSAYLASSPNVDQQQPANMLSAHNKPFEELFTQAKSLAIKTREETYSKIYPNNLTKVEEEDIYESFRRFLPRIKIVLDQSIEEGKKVGLIFGERHKDQKCDLFNQLVVRFAKMYLEDIQAFYSEGNKKIIDMFNDGAKTWKARNRPYNPIKEGNDGIACGVGKVAYFEEIGMPVKHTEALNIGEGYVGREAAGLLEAAWYLDSYPSHPQICRNHPQSQSLPPKGGRLVNACKAD